MYKISDEVIKFIDESMETWRMALRAEGKNLAEVKIRSRIFQGDELSPLLFLITMMPLNEIHRKCRGIYILTKLQD